jgi:hypothetical protein
MGASRPRSTLATVRSAVSQINSILKCHVEVNVTKPEGFNGEEMLPPCPNPKPKDLPLSAYSTLLQLSCISGLHLLKTYHSCAGGKRSSYDLFTSVTTKQVGTIGNVSDLYQGGSNLGRDSGHPDIRFSCFFFSPSR